MKDNVHKVVDHTGSACLDKWGAAVDDWGSGADEWGSNNADDWGSGADICGLESSDICDPQLCHLKSFSVEDTDLSPVVPDADELSNYDHISQCVAHSESQTEHECTPLDTGEKMIDVNSRSFQSNSTEMVDGLQMISLGDMEDPGFPGDSTAAHGAAPVIPEPLPSLESLLRSDVEASESKTGPREDTECCVFDPFYVCVIDEPDITAANLEHERRLLSQYAQQEGIDVNTLCSGFVYATAFYCFFINYYMYYNYWCMSYCRAKFDAGPLCVHILPTE